MNDLERGFAGPHEPEPVVLAVGDGRVVAPVADSARGEEDAVELHLICTPAPRDGDPRFGSSHRIPDDDRPEGAAEIAWAAEPLRNRSPLACGRQRDDRQSRGDGASRAHRDERQPRDRRAVHGAAYPDSRAVRPVVGESVGHGVLVRPVGLHRPELRVTVTERAAPEIVAREEDVPAVG